MVGQPSKPVPNNLDLEEDILVTTHPRENRKFFFRILVGKYLLRSNQDRILIRSLIRLDEVSYFESF